MAQWFIEHIGWVAAGTVAVLLGVKLAVGAVFRRLAAASEATDDDAQD